MTIRLNPSIHPCMEKPYGSSLSYPSVCHAIFGPGFLYSPRFKRYAFLSWEPAGSSSRQSSSTTLWVLEYPSTWRSASVTDIHLNILAHLSCWLFLYVLPVFSTKHFFASASCDAIVVEEFTYTFLFHDSPDSQKWVLNRTANMAANTRRQLACRELTEKTLCTDKLHFHCNLYLCIEVAFVHWQFTFVHRGNFCALKQRLCTGYFCGLGKLLCTNKFYFCTENNTAHWSVVFVY